MATCLGTEVAMYYGAGATRLAVWWFVRRRPTRPDVTRRCDARVRFYHCAAPRPPLMHYPPVRQGRA